MVLHCTSSAAQISTFIFITRFSSGVLLERKISVCYLCQGIYLLEPFRLIHWEACWRESKHGPECDKVNSHYQSPNNWIPSNNILPDKVYFLVNLHSCHTRVLYWLNTVKNTYSRASPILYFSVLGQLSAYILLHWPNTGLCSWYVSPLSHSQSSPGNSIRQDVRRHSVSANVMTSHTSILKDKQSSMNTCI